MSLCNLDTSKAGKRDGPEVRARSCRPAMARQAIALEDAQMGKPAEEDEPVVDFVKTVSKHRESVRLLATEVRGAIRLGCVWGGVCFVRPIYCGGFRAWANFLFSGTGSSPSKAKQHLSQEVVLQHLGTPQQRFGSTQIRAMSIGLCCSRPKSGTKLGRIWANLRRPISSTFGLCFTNLSRFRSGFG